MFVIYYDYMAGFHRSRDVIYSGGVLFYVDVFGRVVGLTLICIVVYFCFSWCLVLLVLEVLFFIH